MLIIHLNKKGIFNQRQIIGSLRPSTTIFNQAITHSMPRHHITCPVSIRGHKTDVFRARTTPPNPPLKCVTALTAVPLPADWAMLAGIPGRENPKPAIKYLVLLMKHTPHN